MRKAAVVLHLAKLSLHQTLATATVFPYEWRFYWPDVRIFGYVRVLLRDIFTDSLQTAVVLSTGSMLKALVSLKGQNTRLRLMSVI